MQNFENASKQELITIFTNSKVVNYKQLNVNLKKKQYLSINFTDIKFYYKNFKSIFRYLLLIKTNFKLKKSFLLNFIVLHKYLNKNLSTTFLNWYIVNNSKRYFYLKKMYFVMYVNIVYILEKSVEYVYIKNDSVIADIVKNYDTIEHKFFLWFYVF